MGLSDCNLIGFLSHKDLLIYCWYRAWNEDKSYVKQFIDEELKNFLFVEKSSYIHIYFSMEPLDELFTGQYSNDKGVYVDRDIWRKKEIVSINAPFMLRQRVRGSFIRWIFAASTWKRGR